ncbi:MAG: DUF2470 domain-containing protein [Nitrosopumilaceae archaeon]|nr:DUF2470 domain-containing protein [Nitrosopumilaceae archaeon]
MAKEFTGVDAEEAAMTSVDRLGMQVRIKAGDEFYSRRIGFLSEAINPEKCREVIVQMVKQVRG